MSDFLLTIRPAVRATVRVLIPWALLAFLYGILLVGGTFLGP